MSMASAQLDTWMATAIRNWATSIDMLGIFAELAESSMRTASGYLGANSRDAPLHLVWCLCSPRSLAPNEPPESRRRLARTTQRGSNAVQNNHIL